MLPALKFFNPTNGLSLVGLGVKRDGADKWTFFMPFRDRDIKFALAISDRRVLAATLAGDLALIDLVAETVIARGTINGFLRSLEHIRLSADGRFAFLQAYNGLYVLNPETLAIERSWTSYKSPDGRFEGFRFDEQPEQIDDQRLFCRFRWVGDVSSDPVARCGFFIFNIVSGAVECHIHGIFNTKRRRSEHIDLYFRDVGDIIYEGKAITFLDQVRSAQRTVGHGLSTPSEFQDFLEREMMVNLALVDDSRAAAIAALEDFTGRVERDIAALMVCGTLQVRFVRDGKTVDAKTLFDRMVGENWNEAVPTLRRLMLTYLNAIGGGEGDMPWHYCGQAYYALRALMLLDGDSQDVYQLYLAKGDPEHDHSPFELYAEYIGRHGIRNQADVRFGVALTVYADGACADIDPTGLLFGAARLVSPEEFAHFVLQASSTHRSQYADFLIEKSTSDAARSFASVVKPLIVSSAS